MSGYKVFIPSWRPKSLNSLFVHWGKAARLKKADTQTVWAYCHQIPKATTKRLVRVKIYLTGRQKPYDQDNCWKSLMDALVKNGLLVDDSNKWVETLPVEFIKRAFSPGTEIYLQDIEPLPSAIAEGAEHDYVTRPSKPVVVMEEL
jgi:Holliday junction resolvase RusA-like endonuclease